MTRISFYILKGSVEHDRQVFACRLIEKAYKQGQHIFVHTENAEQTQQLNNCLWSFRADSFIPHQLAEEASQPDNTILVGHDSKPPRLMDLLINLAAEQPAFFSSFNRVAEFINDDITIKTTGRQRYQFYQQHGYALETHKI
ncbi:MAG: DNA polymerase III subunit chi [Gammaproteobacteria bacterium]|nr:MAG: DNA polymerase III subunit chi [Gammaproteobacteria bacterium]